MLLKRWFTLPDGDSACCSYTGPFQWKCHWSYFNGWFLVDEIDKILSPTKIQRLYNVVDLLHKILV